MSRLLMRNKFPGLVRASHQAMFFAALLCALGVAASPAAAHDGRGLASGFASGFLHPLSGLDHALAMVAVGLWGAILGRPLIVALPTIFPIMMAAGGAIGMAGVPVPPVELGIAISVVTLGSMVLLTVQAPIILASAIVAIFALFHGYAHGMELPSAADPVGYSTGFVLCTGLLHVLGIAIGALKALPNGTLALRAAGAGIALGGLWFLKSAVPL
jgi:urease accessory protein